MRELLAMRELKARRSAARCPSHPGALLREEVFPALHLTVTEAAAKLGVSRQTLHGILAERSSITPEMAVRIGKLCGDDGAIWLRMEQAHDLWRARRHRGVDPNAARAAAAALSIETDPARTERRARISG
jgi:antitoxin HigA-1